MRTNSVRKGQTTLNFKPRFCTVSWKSGARALQCIQKFFSQTLFDFKKSISGSIELKFSGKTL